MNKVLTKKLNQVKNNDKLSNNQKLTKVAQIISSTYDDLLKNKLYDIIISKHIDAKDTVCSNMSDNMNAISDSKPKIAKREDKISNYLNSHKSYKLGKYTYQNNPTKIITTKDFDSIFSTLIKYMHNSQNQIIDSKIYDIYTVHNDGTLTDTTYKVITGNNIKRIENYFMHFEHVFLVPSKCDTHAHFEYHWLKDLFNIGMTINTRNVKTYTKKAKDIFYDMADCVDSNYIMNYRKELVKPTTTLKRKKDLIFETALDFAEYVLYEEY